MSLQEEKDNLIVKQSSGNSITQPLVSAVASSSSPFSSATLKLRQSHSGFQDFFKWKGICLILFWNILVGVIHGLLQCAAMLLALEHDGTFRKSMYLSLGFLGFLSVCQMLLYPVGGLLADLKCGRYKIVTLSQIQITFSFIILSCMGIVFVITKRQKFAFITGIVSSFMMLIGFSGFQSNAVQFGLDQLLDAPSKHLSAFLCWYVWTFNLGELFSHVVGSISICNVEHLRYVIIVPVLIAVVTLILLLFGCCKRDWFYCEMRTHNPYRSIFQVLKFTAKHKHPLKRSAFTYCDDVIPSRIDFAKLTYGGPFTTEVVEDVKTFLRMLVMLFLFSSIFYYTVPGINAFPLYGLHIGRNQSANSIPGCYTDWALLQSGTLSYVVTFFALPLYVLFFQRYVRKVLVRILQRLLVGTVVIVAFMWVLTLLYGVALSEAVHNGRTVSCLFTSEYRDKDDFSPTLQFPTLVLILPNVISGIGWPIVNVAVLEFISAQSPHTMKGLLLGVFYLFRGLFSVLGCLLVFPFASFDYSWKSPYLECGFLYYIFNSLLGVVLILAAMATYKWYRYRQREDKPYDHRYVEDYYRKYVSHSQGSNVIEEDAAQSLSLTLNYHTIPRI